MSKNPSSRKKRPTDAQSTQPTKKHKKNAGQEPSAKGKGRDSEFQVISATLSVSVPPAFAQNPQGGVEEMLDSLIMRYIPSLEGVVIAYSNLTFISKTGRIKGDCPFLLCDIRFDATVWSPKIGTRMKGRVILSSPDHISLLVHRTFNISIPRHHIPPTLWEFEYGPAENDPEFAPEAEEEEGPKSDETSTGKWVNRKTGERLGGEDGKLEFTVIGLTVANEMLSLVGSIQEDPFSPEHKAYRATPTAAATPPTEEVHEASEPEIDDSGSEEEDTLHLLKRKAEKSAREDSSKEKKSTKPSKKKKRKPADGGSP